MNRLVCLCCFSVLLVGAVWAKPLDATADVARLEQMSRFSRKWRLLPQDILPTTRTQATGDSADVALVAMLLLAHADDAESGKVLQHAAADTKRPLHAGAAIYAQCVRKTRTLCDDDAQSSLTFALGRAGNPYTRLFLAVRLHIDFGEGAMTALLADAREEQEPVVQAFLLHYLSESNDAAILRDVAALPWPAAVTIPENLYAIMQAMHPVSATLNAVNPCANLLQQVNAKLNGRWNKSLLDSWTATWWSKQYVRHEEGITAIASLVDLAQVEDAAQRLNRQHVADTLLLCRPLTNTMTGMQFDERRHTVGPRLLRGLLAQPNTLTLSEEVEVVRCLTQFGPGHQREISDAEWVLHRMLNAPLVLHAWQRIVATIDPNYNVNQFFGLQPELPEGAGGLVGMAPEAIDDPKLRAQYEANIERHRQQLAKHNEQLGARKLLQTYAPIAEYYLIALYSHHPDERKEFEKLLASYKVDDKISTRMLQAVGAKLDEREE